jgi:hypothetical protein
MSISTSAITLTTTPQLISSTTGGRKGYVLYISNTSTTVDVYLSGSASDTTSTAFILPARTTYQSANVITVPCEPNETLYAFVGSGTLSIRVMHQGD